MQLKRKIKLNFSPSPAGKQDFLPFPPKSLLSVLPSPTSCRLRPPLRNEAVGFHSTQPDGISSHPLLLAAVARVPRPTRQTWGRIPWERVRHQTAPPGTSGHPPERTVCRLPLSTAALLHLQGTRPGMNNSGYKY